MAASNKHHILLNSIGYILARNRRGDLVYSKEEAPFAVNKFGSGDPAYRDLTFWQYWPQINWRNGCQQEFFDDGGKFWRSQNMDVNTSGQLKLANAADSVGTLGSGVTVKDFFGWRVSQTWWSANYSYRQQLTISAPASQAVPVGHPIKVTIDTSALQTAGKVLANRNDWRVVYWNGSAWVDLDRDYVSTGVTFFAVQTAIAAGGSDSNYYVYYGYSGETTNKQPTTEATWNAVYFSWTDANTVALYHMREGSSTAVNDDSANANNGTATAGVTWGTDGKFGRYTIYDASGDRVNCGTNSSLDLGSLTLEAFIYITGTPSAAQGFILSKYDEVGLQYSYTLHITQAKQIRLNVVNGGTTSTVAWATPLSINTWYHVAATHDGAGTMKMYVNGDLKSTTTGAVTPQVSTATFRIGDTDSGYPFPGYIQHARVSNVARTSFPYAFTTEPSCSAGTETTTQSPASTADVYALGDDGKAYKFDGVSTWTSQFDFRKLEWYESGQDTDYLVGDQAGTERAQAQSFQLTQAFTIKSIEAYLKKNAGTPGDITVRIETNNAGVPSGTLAHANASTTITAFTTATYGWVSVDFASSFALAASTTYWLVLKTAAAANDNNYAFGGDASSPSYSSGNMAASADGGATWSAVAGSDALFRIKGIATSANCSLISSVGGTQYVYIGVGAVSNQTANEARVYRFDGTTWTLHKTFTDTGTFCVLSFCEYGTTPVIYAGTGGVAIVYKTSDASTWSTAKDIDTPNKPGYVYSLYEYNRKMYAAGGSPEYVYDSYFNGFLYITDGTTWKLLYPFEHTVIKSMGFFDSFLFLGTHHGQLYLYDLSSVDILFDFNKLFGDAVTIEDIGTYDDMMVIALKRQPGVAGGNEGIAVFDRHGLSLKWKVSGIRGYTAVAQINNSLYIGTENAGNIYRVNRNTYVSTGNLQSSYFDANLPSVEKLYQSVYMQFKKLPAGSTIELQYKLDEDDASFTSLGTFNTTNATDAIFRFADGVYGKKISIKIIVTTSDTTQTPIIKKVVGRYVPSPDLRFIWRMKVVAADKIELLDGTYETKPGGLLKENVWETKRTRQLFEFKDIDYVATAINQTGGISSTDTSVTVLSTDGFPSKGRLRIENEEIYYTGKTATSFTGLTRGAKDTAKAAHANSTTVDNRYVVLFHQTGEPFSVEETNEGEVMVTLLEA